MKKLITLFTFIFYTSIYAQYEDFGEVVQGVEIISLEQESFSGEAPEMEPTSEAVEEASPMSIPVVRGESDFYGGTKGAFSVSLSGAATYSLPIEVPPGINGVEPNISLAYSSQSDNGYMGYGWTLGGLSAITRVGSTKLYDGHNTPVRFNDEDRFALDGQRLLLKSGVYGKDGAEYQTENFSNLKITSHGVSPYGASFGPNYFRVLYPDGSVAVYGANGSWGGNSRTEHVYALTYISNPQNVVIRYSYTNDNGSLLLTSITYGIRSTNPLNLALLVGTSNNISFTYKNRSRTEVEYAGGRAVKLTKLLDKITVSGFGEIFRSYQLSYNTSSLSYERLTRIEEKSGDGSITKAPVSFYYGTDTTELNAFTESVYSIQDGDGISFNQLASYNSRVYPGDYTGSGNLGFLIHGTSTNDGGQQFAKGNILHIYNPSENQIITQKFQNAGQKPFTDIVPTKVTNHQNILLSRQAYTAVFVNTVNSGTIHYQFSTFANVPNAASAITQLKTQSVYMAGKTNVRRQFLGGDFNGDGITDIIRTEHPYNFDVNNSHNHSTAIEIFNTQNNALYVTPNMPIGFNYQVIDTDGDGYDELIIMCTGKVYIYRFDINTQQLILSNTILDSDHFKYFMPIYIGDFNGDGKLDFVTPRTQGGSDWVFHINLGNGNYTKVVKNLGVNYQIGQKIPKYTYEFQNGQLVSKYTHTEATEYTYLFSDFNNDGKTDIVVSREDYKFIGNNGSEYDNKSYITHHENLLFEGENISFSVPSAAKTLSSANKSRPVVVVSNYNQRNFKTELALISDNKLKILKHKKDNAATQRLMAISEYDLSTGISYDIYNKNKSTTEDLVDFSGSYKESLSIYPKMDVEVIPGMHLVSKVHYNLPGVLISGSGKRQLFSYADPVVDHSGLGFLGFKGRMTTNVFVEIKDQIRSVVKSNVNQRGLPLEELTATKDQWFNFFGNNNGFISKTTHQYSITNYSNKVFRALNTKSIVNDGITGVERTITNASFDTYGNPQTITEQLKKDSETSTLTTAMVYTNNVDANNYYIGRPQTKTVRRNGVQVSKETYTYNGYLLTSVAKQGATSTASITETNEYDVFGNVTKKTITATDIQPRIASYQYDTSGRYIEKSTDTEGLQTNYVYNKPKGWLLSETNPYGLTTNYQYNSVGMPVSTTDYLGNHTYFYYKIATIFTGNYLYKETHYPDGKKENIRTNFWGNKILESFTDIEGNWIYTSYQYDTQNRLLKQSEPYRSTATLYTTYEYDDLGRVKKISMPTGKEISTSYNGLTTTVNDGVKTRSETVNVNGATKQVTDNGQTINYTYNTNGTLANTNYSGHVISFVYDGWGRKISMTDPSAGTHTYQYNSIGDLLKETNPKGTTLHTYDSTGSLTKTVIGGTISSTTDYTYGTDKLLTKITSVSDGITYTENYIYDAYKRLKTKQTLGNGIFGVNYEYIYDVLGRVRNEKKVIQSSSMNHTVSLNRAYKNGYLWKLTDATTNKDLKVYNSFNERGQLTDFSLGNGLKEIRTYNPYGYLTQSKLNKVNNSTLFTLTNSWDVQRGNLTSRQNTLYDELFIENFTYDTFDRLTSTGAIFMPSETYLPGSVENIQYDGRGRITKSKAGSYTYDNSKVYRLATVENIGEISYYEQNPLQEVTYNARNLPLTIKQQGKENVYFKYDGLGNKRFMYFGNLATTTTQSAKERYYSPSGDVELEFTRNNSAPIKLTIYVDGDPYGASIVLRKQSNTTAAYYYLHRDYLGSIMAITNNSGNITEKRYFDAWGNMNYVQDGQGNNLAGLTFLDRGYTGHEHLQGVGLINMNARLYDPKLHRFLGVDNYVQDPGNSQNYNGYGYVYNNPLKFTDPSGEIIWTVFNAIVDTFRGAFNSFNFDYNRTENAWKLFTGKFHTDSNRSFGGRVLQFVGRFTWEVLQTEVGYNYSQIRNIGGSVDRVEYFGGATFAINENVGKRNGISLGNYININLREGFNQENHVSGWMYGEDGLYWHEYGHTFQSERYGIGYLFGIGLPSVFSASESGHNFKPYERQANRWAWKYANKHGYMEHWLYPIDKPL